MWILAAYNLIRLSALVDSVADLRLGTFVGKKRTQASHVIYGIYRWAPEAAILHSLLCGEEVNMGKRK